MRLVFTPNNQIIFQKFSNDRMGGIIQIRNPSNIIMSFKIKCTNPQLFEVTPLKGVLRSGQLSRIQFVTTDPVNLDFAKQLVMNHKFLIQYVPITSEYAVPNFKSHEAQRKKFYLNMDSLRNGSRLLKDNDKMQIKSEISNRMSYISMKNQMKDQTRNVNNNHFISSRKKIQSKNNINNNQQIQQKYSKLKQQLDDLHRERQQIVNKMSNMRKNSSINIKKIIIFILFLFIGTFLGSGIKKYQQYKKEQQQLEKKKMQDQQSGWNFFGIFSSLYDDVEEQ